MITFNLLVKSGTAGYTDYDNCDLILKRNVKTACLPRKDEIVSYIEKGRLRKFLITEVNHFIDTDSEGHNDSYNVYCVPIDGKSAIISETLC